MMIFAVLHDGEIAISELIRSHLTPRIVCRYEGKDGHWETHLIIDVLKIRSYRILHDVTTRCTFLGAMENHKTLLFRECEY